MGFQRQVNIYPGVAAIGDFADANIRAVVLSGAGGMISAPAPRSPIVGHFAWGDQASDQAFSRYFGELTAKLGFVHRENNAIIVPFLADDQMYLEAGLVVTLFEQGSFWAKFAAGAAVGKKVFANYLDGSVYAGVAGASTQTADFTASIDVTTGVLHLTVLNSGALHVGDVVTGAGVPSGTAITAQLSGAIGGVGTYQTTIVTAVAGGAMLAHGSVETSFSVDSPAAAGELAKISTWG